MNGADDMKMKLLDELEQHMDAHDGDAYMNKRNPQQVASLEPEPAATPTPTSTPNPDKQVQGGEKKPRTYMDKDREQYLRDQEQQSMRDPIMMRGQFAKRKA